jgi:single-stranded DNA-specific DHH superfamily exonuclease
MANGNTAPVGRLLLIAFALASAAMATVAIVAEMRHRALLREAATAMRAQTERLREENAQRRRDVAEAEAELRREAARKLALERIEREGKYVPAADPAMQAGTLGCLDGHVVRREANGWQQVLEATRPVRCRTDP